MTFGVQKIDHVNAVVTDLEAAVDLWRDLTGLEPHPTATHDILGLRNADFVFADGNQFGLMTPLPNNEMGDVIQGFIDRRGEGLYIISLAVDDPEAVSEELTRQDVRMIPLEEGMGFVHPKSANGVSVEYIRPGVSDKPQSPPVVDGTHRVVGLHHISLAVDDLADASRRWETLLGGVKMEPAGHSTGVYGGALATISNGGIGLAEPAIRDDSDVVFRAMRKGEGFLSLSLDVDNVEACATALNAKGWQVEVTGAGIAYVSAKSTRGVMVELIQGGG